MPDDDDEKEKSYLALISIATQECHIISCVCFIVAIHNATLYLWTEKREKTSPATVALHLWLTPWRKRINKIYCHTKYKHRNSLHSSHSSHILYLLEYFDVDCWSILNSICIFIMYPIHLLFVKVLFGRFVCVRACVLFSNKLALHNLSIYSLRVTLVLIHNRSVTCLYLSFFHSLKYPLFIRVFSFSLILKYVINVNLFSLHF